MTPSNTPPTVSEEELLRQQLENLEVIVVMGDDEPYPVTVALPQNQVDAIMHLIKSHEATLKEQLYAAAVSEMPEEMPVNWQDISTPDLVAKQSEAYGFNQGRSAALAGLKRAFGVEG